MENQKKTSRILVIGLLLAGLSMLACLGGASAVTATPRPADSRSADTSPDAGPTSAEDAAPEPTDPDLDDSSLAIGSTAPDFELESLGGETVRLSDFRGQPLILNIGATWCPDCRKAAPILQATHEKYPDLVILDVDIQEGKATIQSYVDDLGLTYTFLLDSDGKVAEQYLVWAIPTVLFIDTDGVIQAKIIEAVTPEKVVELLPLIGVQP
jgi:thiol-disulfide isomerase/thioredoxin